MNKTIWIINEYAGSPYHGMEFRHYYLSRALIKRGYKVSILSASYSHLFKELPVVKDKFTLQNIDGVDYLWIKVPPYSAAHSKKRVIKWLVYTTALFFLPIDKLSKPDYIIVSPMQTLPIYPALKWAKKFNSKLIFEIKDIWPLSIIELGGYSDYHPFILLLKYFEKMAIKKSDAIVSVLPNYNRYLNDLGFEKTAEYIPNGVDLSEMECVEPLAASIEEKIPKNKFLVMYTGTLGVANAMHYLIDVARILKEYQDIFFIIVGNGSEREKLIKQAEGMSNILFLPSVPKRQIQSLLQKASICYMGAENKRLYQYGVSPNKIFDYMYAAKPILFAIDSPNNPVEKAQCGIVVKNSNQPSEIANGIIRMYQLPEEERIKMGMNGKNFVITQHSFDVLAEKYHQLFCRLS